MPPANPLRTVVVTGAAGFIGSHTVDRLLADGHRVFGIDDLSTGSSSNVSRALNHGNFELTVQDVVTPRFLETFCERHRPDAIIRLFFVLPVPAKFVAWGTGAIAFLMLLSSFSLSGADYFGTWAASIGSWFWLGPGGRRRRLKKKARTIETQLRVLQGGRNGPDIH